MLNALNYTGGKFSVILASPARRIRLHRSLLGTLEMSDYIRALSASQEPKMDVVAP